MSSAYLTIRLSPNETKLLTKLRAEHELATLERITIKHLLLKLVQEAYAAHLRGELHLPVIKTAPEVPARIEGAPDNPEQISILKEPKDEIALATICYGVKRPLEYGQSDAVREIMKWADARNASATASEKS